jgi:hypothetical protein
MTSGHARFCDLAAKGRSGYVALMCGESPPPPDFPPLAEQAANLAGAAVRFVVSGLKVATPEEQARRLAICQACGHFSGKKCRICGCASRWKARLSSEHCPDKPPRW